MLEVDIIKSVLNRWIVHGYTLILAKGYWEGRSEDTAIIEIYGDYNLGIVSSLKQELKQESLLVVELLCEEKLL